MFRVSVLILGLAFCCMGYGCACCQQEPPVERTREPVHRPTAQSEGLAAALLFDRTPGPYDASQFTLRSDWPSTESFYSFGQVVYSREQLIDEWKSSKGKARGGWAVTVIYTPPAPLPR